MLDAFFMNKRSKRLDDALFRDADGNLATEMWMEEAVWQDAQDA